MKTKQNKTKQNKTKNPFFIDHSSEILQMDFL
jgi:hypothetical protein